MRQFSWKKRLLMSGAVLGGGVVSFLASGFLPNAIMPFKLFLFFTSIGCVVFAGSTILGSGIEQSLLHYHQYDQRFHAEKVDELDKEVQDILLTTKEKEEDRPMVQEEKNKSVEPIKVEPTTPLDNLEQEILLDTKRMAEKAKKQQQQSEEQLENEEEEEIER